MLHLHRAEDAESLVGPLAAVLAAPRDDPFVAEVVCVPTRGIERWLAQRLSHHLGAGADGEAGICAGVVFESPTRVMARVRADLDGRQGFDPDEDPWAPDRALWPLLELIEDSLGEPWARPLVHHLGGGSDERSGRRLALAAQLAARYASYGTQRPSLVLDWAGLRHGEDAAVLPPAAAVLPPAAAVLPPAAADVDWQVELWRRLRARLDLSSPAERLAEAVRRLAEEPGATSLPPRISIFGATRLPRAELDLLGALARHRDVHLWLPHPSPALWDAAAHLARTSPRRADSGLIARHPMLASMARDSLELQQRLLALAGPDGDPDLALEDVRHGSPPDPRAASEPADPTLLAALHRALREDDPTPGRHRHATGDRSLQVHACHGRARQVEVMREVILGLLADDPTLHPRDILVMCPDVEQLAPLVSATFGLAAADDATSWHPGQRLPLRLADRALRQTNDHLALLATLLDLGGARLTAGELLDLAAAPAVRTRFGFTDDDLLRLREWVIAAGIRWGEGIDRRSRFGLPHVAQGTWQFGLDRLLAGAAVGGDDPHRYLGTALPLDDVESTDLDLAGRFAELVDRLVLVLEHCAGRHPVTEWWRLLEEALDLLAGEDPDALWHGVEARRMLADLAAAAEGHDEATVCLDDIRALLAGRLAGRPTRAGFRTGALTVCSLEPMRAVPHRVVVLIGLDDGTFPRTAIGDGDDILLRDPWVGERDRRSEDRQLFLDAVTSAREHLIVIYSGADERLGTVRPPAVPVGELLDALDRLAVTDDRRPVREHLTVHHPLHPVDRRNFTRGALGHPGPFSHDRHAHVAAVRLAQDGRPLPAPGPHPLLPAPLPVRPVAAAEDAVDLDDLIGLLEHPAKWFARHQLGVWLPGDDDELADALPLTLDPLTAWGIGDRLLQACLSGVERERARGAENRRGLLPPRRLGQAALDDIDRRVAPIARAALDHLGSAQDRLVDPLDRDVAVDLPDGGRLTGTVGVVRRRDGSDEAMVRATYSRLGAKHRLRAWVQLLALTAAGDDGPRSAVTIGRAPGGRPAASVSTLRPPAGPVALKHLSELVRLRRRALREPLPMPVDAAAAYARSRQAGDLEEQALDAARNAWARPGTADDPYHRLCWGAQSAFEALCAAPTREEQAWAPQEGTRLGVHARRVWDVLLAHEEVRTR